MRPFTDTIPFDEALRIVMSAAKPIERRERVPLAVADGRVVAGAVRAEVDVPPFDRAAMDGYAVMAEDTGGARTGAPVPLALVDRVFTGQAPTRHLQRGECIEVATGAPMPAGADAVVMVEETDHDPTDDGVIRFRAAAVARQNIGRRAADLAAGAIVVSAGQVLSPASVGAIAATGIVEVDVFGRPSVAILSTGNEIVEPGGPLGPGQIYDINRFTIAAAVARHGGHAVPLAPVGDSIESLDGALETALAEDVVVFSGGSSVGERDLIIDVLRSRGQVLFHGIAVKPGKPTALAIVQGRPVFAMPGYPTSCLSNAYMLLAPFLRKMARLPPWTPTTRNVPLARRINSAPGRHQFYTVRMVNGQAEPAFKASGDITSMANADGYIEIPATTDAVEAGTVVTVKLFS